MRNSTFQISALLLAVLIYSGCADRSRSLVPSESVAVRVLCAGDSLIRGERNYVATIKSAHNVLMTSPFPAKITKMSVKEGQYVRRGDVIAVLYSESVQSAVKVADASLAQARDGYSRLMKVKDNGSVPAIKIVEVETSLAKAEAASASAHKALEDCTVKASVSGVVSDVLCIEGTDVTLSQPLVKITDTGALEAEISIPEADLSLLKVGQRGTMTVPALSDVKVPVTLGVKGVSADPLARTYKCVLQLDRIYNDMMPGMVGKVKFNTSYRTSCVIVIPADKIRMDTQGKYVWTLDSLDNVCKKYVVPGGFSGKGVIIDEGLECGERVIVEGASKVSTGMKVRVIE